jgi:catechol 2,3-dioxygenase-like lactoylglutathione lyase family enzyme
MFLLAAVLPALGQLPDYYKSVDRIVWVADDLDRTLASWKKLGVVEAGAPHDVEGDILYRNKLETMSSRWTVGRFGDVVVDFIQPLGGKSASADFKHKHGAGIMALLHRVPDATEFKREIARLRGLGVEILEGGQGNDSGAYVLFDTEAQGKYVLGLIYGDPSGGEESMEAPPLKPGARKVSQYAFVAKDLDAVSAYWQKLGWPAMSFTHPALTDLQYRGKPGEFDAKLGWQRQGKVVYEWILPLKGPTVYNDHIAKHGEGVHHLALNVDDIAREESEWTKAGYPTAQSGAWGDKGKPGSGRFAYQDTHAIGGIDVELLWNFRH